MEEETPVSEPPNPVTRTEPPRNDGASRADSDAELPDRRSDEEEGLDAKKTRPPRHVLQYEVVWPPLSSAGSLATGPCKT